VIKLLDVLADIEKKRRRINSFSVKEQK